MEERLFDIGYAAAISVVAVGIVFRTPLASYMTGSKKIFGVI